jgi:hypothetical protein
MAHGQVPVQLRQARSIGEPEPCGLDSSATVTRKQVRHRQLQTISIFEDQSTNCDAIKRANRRHKMTLVEESIRDRDDFSLKSVDQLACAQGLAPLADDKARQVSASSVSKPG